MLKFLCPSEFFVLAILSNGSSLTPNLYTVNPFITPLIRVYRVIWQPSFVKLGNK